MAENIYIQPVVVSGSKVPEGWLLEVIARRLTAVFTAKAMVEKTAVVIPDRVYNPRRKQYSAEMSVEFLARERKPGKVLAVADFDLYSPSLNFVFGLAAMSLDIAIISLSRLRQEFYRLPPNRIYLTARTVKEAVHETGHLYGLAHCPDTRCVMHFSNSLPDTDKKHETPCVQCSEKIKSTD